MDTRVLGLVMALAFTNVQGYTKDDLEAKLTDVKTFLNVDIRREYLSQLIKDTELYLGKTKTSSAVQCVYSKSEWYLKTYFDPLMDGFIQYQSFALNIDQLEEEINDVDYTNPSAVAKLYQEIDGHKNAIEKERGAWIAYMDYTIPIVHKKYEKCLELK